MALEDGHAHGDDDAGQGVDGHARISIDGDVEKLSSLDWALGAASSVPGSPLTALLQELTFPIPNERVLYFHTL